MEKFKICTGRARQLGFTLIEMLIVIAILAVLINSSIPFLGDYFDKKRLIAATEAVYSQLQMARGEAIARSRDIYVQFDTDGEQDWSFGISEVSGCNPDDGLADANPCYLIIDDGDGITASSDEVLQNLSSNDYPGISMTNVTFGGDEAKFKYARGTAKAGSVKLESASGYRIKVITGLIGRIRICSPPGVTYVAGYPDSCSW